MQKLIPKGFGLQFLYFALFYLIMSAVFYWAIFINYKIPNLVVSKFANSKNENKIDIKKYVSISDSINKIIALYNPNL